MGDASLITHEILTHIKKRRQGRQGLAAIKIDMNKAYDRIQWDFLRKVLEGIGFPEDWISVIMECVMSVKYQVLINGEASKKITPKCGLRQGDPLSPYLFILCMEVLSHQIRDLEISKELKGIKISKRASSIWHMFFADDVIFFIQATNGGCQALRSALAEFCDLSGEVINLSKSSIIFSPNTSEERKHELKGILAIQHREEFGTYLGAPAVFSASKSSAFKSLCDKVNTRISSWAASPLTQAGKMVLISGILSTMCNHVMSISLLPKKTTNQLDSMIKIFFWKSKGEERGSTRGISIYWKHRKEWGGVWASRILPCSIKHYYLNTYGDVNITKTTFCHNSTNTNTTCYP